MRKKTIQKNSALLIPLVLWLLAANLVIPTRICAQDEHEYALKAAFLLNFAQVTSWPDNAFKDSAESIDLCLAGDKKPKEAFRSIDKKQVGDRILRIRSIPTASDCRGCEILFISKDIDRPALLRFLAAVNDRPVLSIGETPDFAKIGGIINFINKKGRLSFEINPKEAKQRGLKISSHILQLATIVENN